MKKRRVTGSQANYAGTSYDIKDLIFTFFDARDQALAAGVNEINYRVSKRANREKIWKPSGNDEIDNAVPPSHGNPQQPLEGRGLHDITELDLSNSSVCDFDRLSRVLNRFRNSLVSLKWPSVCDSKDDGVMRLMTERILKKIFNCSKLEELKLGGFLFIHDTGYLLGDLKNLRAFTITRNYMFNSECLFTKRNDRLEILECDSSLITKNIGNLFNLQSLLIDNMNMYTDYNDPEASMRRERAIANLRHLPKKYQSKQLKIAFEIPPTLNILLEFLKHIPDTVDCLEFYVEKAIQNIIVRDEDRVVSFENLSPGKQNELSMEVSDELQRLKKSGCEFLISGESNRSPLLDFLQESIEQVQETSSCIMQY